MNEIENAISNINYGLHYEDCGNMVVITKFSACQALWALEKQVPKKAEYHHKANGECALIICPNCENRLTVARYVFRLDRYCKECGQHYVVDIKDWSVEEDIYLESRIKHLMKRLSFTEGSTHIMQTGKCEIMYGQMRKGA